MYRARKTPLGFAVYYVTDTVTMMVGNDFYPSMAAARAEATRLNAEQAANLARAESRRGSAYFPDGEEDRVEAEEERRLPTLGPDPDDDDLLAFVEVAPGEFDAYRHNYLIASITTRQDGIRVLWDDSRGSDEGPALRADPRRFATIDAAQMAVRQETR